METKINNPLNSNTRLFNLLLLVISLMMSCEPPEFPVPIISSIDPPSGPHGLTITIKGKYLENATAVGFNDINVDFKFNNRDSILVDVPQSVPVGEVDVSVISKQGQSKKIKFTVTPIIPVINRIEPITGKVGERMTIIGSNFSDEMVVNFGDIIQNEVDFINGTALATVIPENVVPGNQVSVTVSLPDGSSKSAEYSFNIQSDEALAPIIENVSATEGSPGDKITVTGKNFITGMTFINFSGILLEENKGFVINSEKQITITVPQGAKSGSVVIDNSYDTIGFNFIIIEAPLIERVIPQANSAGGPILIYGKNFDKVKYIKFGNTQILSADYKLSKDKNGQEILYGRVPSANVGPIKLSLKNIREHSSNEVDYTIQSGTLDLPLGFSNVVVPNPLQSPVLLSMNNNWLLNDGSDNRLFLDVGETELAPSLFPILDGLSRETIGVYKKDGSFVSININSVLYEGQFDSKYGSDQLSVRRVILTPLESGPQVEMIFPLGIDELKPAQAKRGDVVTIIGRYFNNSDFSDFSGVVNFDDTQIFGFNNGAPGSGGFKRISITELEFTIPLDATIGNHTIYLVSGNGDSNSLSIKVIN